LLALVLGGIVTVTVLLGVQASLVGTVFRTPLQAGDRDLPSTLDGLAGGSGPLAPADLPFALPSVGPGSGFDSPVVPGDAVDAPGEVATGSTGGRGVVTSPLVAALSGWAAQLGLTVGVPAVALAAYGAAQLQAALTDPGCHLSWTTLAGIGWVESDHGRYDVRDSFDIDDAALAAARYLCAAGGDLSTGAGWTAAVFAYNASDSYVIAVRTAADRYATMSQAGPAG